MPSEHKFLLHESPIRCIFFSEFHDQAGPKITYQVPEDFISKEQFDAISVYIIPKAELQKKLITVNTFGWKIIGFPVSIEHARYDRNWLLFNICFVCDSNKRTIQYEPLVQKLANCFVTLEVESDFLSNEVTKAHLPRIMKEMLQELNLHGYCSIQINESNTIHLKVVHIHDQPNQVQDHHVPIFTKDRANFLPSQWDLTTQQILPYIDGYRHVARIAAETDVDVSLVKACIQNMVYYGVVTLIPIFQYSNVYMPTPNIIQLTENKALQEECIKFVAKQERNFPTFKAVFTLYCSLAPGSTIRDLCTRHNPHALGVDERKLIQFGLMKGFIRRLQKYPVQLTPDPHAPPRQKALAKYFTGSHSYDDICCKTALSYQELEERIEKDASVASFYK